MRLLTQALRGTAACRVVLVASDYDGTLAPIVTDPDRAYPEARAMSALASLAVLPDTHAAILSGRQLSVLEALSGRPSGVTLIGSHGAEAAGGSPDVEAQARQDLAAVGRQLADLCDEFPGSRLETKPAGVAFHFRNVDPARQSAAQSEARRIGLDFPVLVLIEGKKVVEFVGSAADKGDALVALRDRVQADVVVFIGDDVTDEDAFAVLRPVDVGLKVGPRATRARFRVDDQTQVAGILETLLAFRTQRPEIPLAGC